MKYKALYTQETKNGFESDIRLLDTDNLPAGEVLVKVHYSSLNYKDALSATGNKGVTKNYPHTPGIDAAGTVVSSEMAAFKPGDQVIVSGNDLGMNTPGGFAEYIRVPAEWVVKLPANLSMKEAMIIGTAGFSAGISVLRLTELVKPADGKIIVTGATGGVGSVALSILNGLGYDTVAVSGKASEHEFLKSLGVSEIISRDTFAVTDSKPVHSARFAGGIDTVGGVILENIVKTLKPLGAVTTCGSVSGTQLSMSVFPFILRGISLIGVSSQNYPFHLRQALWQKLALEMKPTHLMNIYTEISLEELIPSIDLILQGKLKGRTVVKIGSL